MGNTASTPEVRTHVAQTHARTHTTLLAHFAHILHASFARPTPPLQLKSVVVVLGGGYGGIAAAKALDATGRFFVVLVERREFFANTVGALRASLDTAAAKQQMVPYTRLLKHGIVLRGDIEEVRATEVVLHGRSQPLSFDYLVIATGSSYNFPNPVADLTIADQYRKWDEFGARVRESAVKNVVIVGGGSVGIELAGELREFAPAVNVTLVHSGSKLIHNEPLRPAFLDGVNKQLAGIGVKVIFNQRVPVPSAEQASAASGPSVAGSYYFGLGNVSTSTGESLPADLLVFSVGGATNTRSLESNFGSVLEHGRLAVNAHMQVRGHTNVFAVGDIAAGATKRAMYAGEQAEVAAKNIIALEDARVAGTALDASKLTSFAVRPGHPLLLTLGSKGGMSQFFNKGETVFGSCITSMIKSKSLFADQQWATLNAKSQLAQVRKTNKNLDASETRFDASAPANEAKVKRAVEYFGGDEAEVREMLSNGLPVRTIDANQTSL